MTDIVDIGGARFAQATEARQLRPRDALVEGLRRIDAGEIDATHIMICFATGAGGFDYLNTGSLDGNGNVGLLARVQAALISRLEG